jgi:hypothetical protein
VLESGEVFFCDLEATGKLKKSERTFDGDSEVRQRWLGKLNLTTKNNN